MFSVTKPARRAQHRRVQISASTRIDSLEPRRLFAAIAWDGGAGTNNWTDALNWDLDRTPAAADDVTIGSNAPATVSILGTATDTGYPGAAVSVNSLHSAVGISIPSISSLAIAASSNIGGRVALAGTISGNGDLTLNGGLDWTGGSMNGTATTYLTAGSTTSMSSTATKTLGRTLDVRGAVLLSSGLLSTGTVNDGTPALRIHDGGSFALGGEHSSSGSTSLGNVNGAREVVVDAGGSIIGASAGIGFPQQVNLVRLRIGGQITATSDSPLTITNGIFEGGTISSPTPQADRTVPVTLSGNVTGVLSINAGDTVTGAGLAIAAGAHMDVSGSLTVTSGQGSVGGVSGGGDLNVKSGGSLLWNNGAMTGGGTTRVDAGGTFTIGTGFTYTLARRLEVSGAFNQSPSAIPTIQFGSTLASATSDVGVLDLLPGSSFVTKTGIDFSQTVNAPAGHIEFHGATVSITDPNASSLMTIAVALLSDNTTYNISGRLQLRNGGSFTGHTAINIAPDGHFSLQSGSYAASGGAIDVAYTGAAGTHPNGFFDMSAFLTASSLTLSADASLRVGGSFSGGGNGTPQTAPSISGAGNIEILTGGNFALGPTFGSGAPFVLSGTGKLILDPGSTATIQAVASTRDIDVSGTATISGLSLGDNAHLYARSGSAVTLASGISLIAGTTALGSVEVDAGATLTANNFQSKIFVPFHNRGTVQAINGGGLYLEDQDVDYLTGTWNLGALGLSLFDFQSTGQHVHDIRGSVTSLTPIPGLDQLNRISGTLILNVLGSSNVIQAITPAGGTLSIEGTLGLGIGTTFAVTGNVRFAGLSPTLQSQVNSSTTGGKNTLSGVLTASGVLDLTASEAVTTLAITLRGSLETAPDALFPVVYADGGILGAFDRYTAATTPAGNALLISRPDANTLNIVVGSTPPAPAPTLTGAVFDYAAGDIVALTFDQDVSALLGRKEWKLHNLTTGQDIPAALGTVAYNTATNRATLTFPNGTLPDGDYQLSIAAADIDNSAGVPLATPVTLNFFALRGDLNRDRVVNFSDLVILAQHYNTTGNTFAQGNLDHSADGKVDFSDLVILAQQYNKALPALPSLISRTTVVSSLASRSTSAVPTTKTGRVATEVLS